MTETITLLRNKPLDILIHDIVRLSTRKEAVWLRQRVRNLDTAPLVKGALIDDINERVGELGL
jgi:hypothetical protein